MAGNIKLQTSAGGGVILDTATTTATDVTVKVPVTGVNNGTLVCSDSSGNVGIGTSSPGQKLDVNGNVSGSGLISTGGGSSSVASIRLVDTGTGFYHPATDTIGFITAGSERMRINSSGNLLVRTTTIRNSGIISVDYAGNSAGGMGINDTDSANASPYIAFLSGGTFRGSIINNNNTAVAYNTTSDYRLKENIAPMTGALAKVAQLNPVTYTWKADGSDGQGFIAHELQAVVPDCVTGEKDAVDADGNPVYQGIDTSFLVATLTKAIQELSAKNDALEARIAALEAK